MRSTLVSPQDAKLWTAYGVALALNTYSTNYMQEQNTQANNNHIYDTAEIVTRVCIKQTQQPLKQIQTYN